MHIGSCMEQEFAPNDLKNSVPLQNADVQWYNWAHCAVFSHCQLILRVEFL